METPISMTFDELEGLLKPLLQQHLQVCSTSTEQSTETGMDLQEPDVVPALENLRRLIENHTNSTQGLDDVQGVPLPEVDEQLGPLQQEVEDVLQRLAGASGLRKTVPALMSAALEQQLQALRPPQDSTPDTDQAEDNANDAQQLETAKQLHHAMRDALNKLPVLRARLEEMEGRLGRNLAAIDTAQTHASQPPPTVERVLRGVAAGRTLAAGADHA